MKKIIKDYLTFTKKERTAVVVLLCLIAAFIALPYFFTTKKKPVVIDKEVEQQLAQLQKPTNKDKQDDGDNYSHGSYASSSNNTAPITFETFAFDPNTLDFDGWKRLGLRDKTANMIMNYRNKGGRFRSAEDLRKIWGLEKEIANRIIPFAKVENATLNNTYKKFDKPEYKNNAITSVDINTATVDELRKVPGMDYPNQYKIVKFRERLGGFLSVQQVKETQGLPDFTYNKILPYLKLQTTTIKKLNINIASDYELSSHPYIEKNIAKAIVIYRNQHGNYKTVSDIKKIVFMNDAVYNKIVDYLTVE